jgi:hypothetical protein
VTNLPIEERLLHYFLAMGAQPVEPLRNLPTGLTVELGLDKVHIAVLKNDAFLERGKIIESIMDLLSGRHLANQIYLAAPRLLGTSLDAELFRSHGIGLLLFDERRIDETISPHSFPVHQSDASDQNTNLGLVTEVATLKSMYSEMQETVAKLHEDLKNLRESFCPAPSNSERIRRPQAPSHELSLTAASSELPAFFTNNPWLDVLSKRGREEAPPLAG